MISGAKWMKTGESSQFMVKSQMRWRIAHFHAPGFAVPPSVGGCSSDMPDCWTLTADNNKKQQFLNWKTIWLFYELWKHKQTKHMMIRGGIQTGINTDGVNVELINFIVKMQKTIFEIAKKMKDKNRFAANNHPACHLRCILGWWMPLGMFHNVPFPYDLLLTRSDSKPLWFVWFDHSQPPLTCDLTVLKKFPLCCLTNLVLANDTGSAPH